MTAPLDTSELGTESGTRPSQSTAIDRLVRLQRLTAELAGAMDTARIAQVVVDHILVEVGAASACFWLVEDDEIRLVRHSGYTADAVACFAKQKIEEDFPVGDALLKRASILLRDRADYAARYPKSEQRASTFVFPAGATVCLPLTNADRRAGALTYTFDEARTFDADERSYFDLLAVHVFEALERVRLFKAERTARMHVEALYELTTAAARASTLDEIFEPALEAVCRVLAVERASILLFDASGAMRFRAWRELSSEYRHAVDGHSPWSRDEQAPEPILVEDVTKDQAWKDYLPIFEKENIRALAFVPLVHERRLLGKFMIYCAEPRCLSQEDVKLASAIATQLAQAIARSIAQDETRQARAAAEEAARSRAEMVAVVAHDLRNPLGVAQLKAQLMMRKVPEGPDGEKMKRDLELIFRNTQHMARLIGDLLDAATIEANRIAVEKAPNSIAEIAGEAVDLVRMLAEQKGLAVTVESTPSDAVVNCDRARVLQVLSNLLGNAIKYTPADGKLTVTARANGPEVMVSVEDTGPGIPLAERERVFERYVHGRQRGSVGLGLFIARGLVAAHGGRIWIEDASGPSGTRVCFTLAAA